MPVFKVEGEVKADGSWNLRAVVPGGQTVHGVDVCDLLVAGLAFYQQRRGERLLTEPERMAHEAERAIPDGWEATNDGINVYQTLGEGGGTRYTRWYQRGETRIEAVCAADGSPLPETRTFLLAQGTPEA